MKISGSAGYYSNKKKYEESEAVDYKFHYVLGKETLVNPDIDEKELDRLLGGEQ